MTDGTLRCRLLCLAIALAPAPAWAAQDGPTRILIDTDPGVDDAMAVLLALRSPAVEVVALTTVFGNVTTEQAVSYMKSLVQGDPDQSGIIIQSIKRYFTS